MSWRAEEFQSKYQKIQDVEEEEEETEVEEEIAEEEEIMVVSRAEVENEEVIERVLKELEENEIVEEVMTEKKKVDATIAQEEIQGIQVLKEEIEEKVSVQIILEQGAEGETGVNY